MGLLIVDVWRNLRYSQSKWAKVFNSQSKHVSYVLYLGHKLSGLKELIYNDIRNVIISNTNINISSRLPLYLNSNVVIN